MLDILISNSETENALLRMQRESGLNEVSANRQEPYGTIEDSLLGGFFKSFKEFFSALKVSGRTIL